jgi:nucleoid DNA-binding protein
MATVTKRELVVELSNRSGLTQTQVFDLFQSALELITEELAKGNEVTLRRFGTFEVRISKPKIGRNPNKPGSDMRIPPRTVVRFKPGNEMKAKVAELLSKLPADQQPGTAA